jgi:2-polyprenyl-3-methyl-5-hydroxy-6-metoxy-1,4-benzoquinol methylase
MPPDLTHRANLEEQMDSLPSYQEYRTCLHDLDSVSRTVLAHRPTLHFLDQLLAREPTHIPRLLRILDVACGDGAMLRRIARWAARQNLPVQLTGLDLNPRAIEVAHEFPITHPPIRYIIGDVFDSTGTYDIILSAHFTHHLSDPQLLRFLHWMERHATLGWFINDLHRHPNP